MTDSAARTTSPAATKCTAASISGARNRSGPGPGTVARRAATTAPVAGAGLQRRAQLDAAGGGEQLDGEHPGQAVDGRGAACGPRTSPSTRGPPAWRCSGSSRRWPARRGASAPRRARPGCTGRSCGRSRRPGRRRGTAAGRCCADWSRNRSVRRSEMLARSARHDRQEVEDVGDRGAVEVAVGLDAAVERDDRVVDRRRRARARRPRRRGRACRGRRRRPAARSAASTRPAPGCTPRCGATRGSRCPRISARRFAADAAWPGCGRSACRSSAKTSSVPSSPSTLIAAVTSAAVTSRRRSVMARTSMPSIPSVPLISARPSFSARVTGAMPCSLQRGRRRHHRAVANPDRPLAHQPRARSGRAARGRRSSRASRTRAPPA